MAQKKKKQYPERFLDDFTKNFPEVRSLQVRVKLSYAGEDEGEYVRRHYFATPRIIPAALHCSNPYCYSGSLNLFEPIAKAIKSKESNVSDSIICMGKEGAPRSADGHRTCHYFCEYDIEVEYNP